MDPAFQCTVREFISSFKSPLHAIFWLGGSTFQDYLRRDAELAAARKGEGEGEGEGSPAYLVFDVETDGGAGKQLAIQLGYVVFDSNHEELFSRERLLRLPKGRRISWHATNVHKITDNKLHLRGVDPAPELEIFFSWVDRVGQAGGRVIAHNAAFDAAVVTNTAASCGVSRTLAASDCFCTMRRATLLAGLRNKNGAPKPPTNSELYEILHGGQEPSWARLHSAEDDARITAASFHAGCVRGWWHA